MILLWIQQGASSIPYFSLSLALLMIIWQILAKPYILFLENFSITVNQVSLFLYQVVLILKAKGLISPTF